MKKQKKNASFLCLEWGGLAKSEASERERDTHTQTHRESQGKKRRFWARGGVLVGGEVRGSGREKVRRESVLSKSESCGEREHVCAQILMEIDSDDLSWGERVFAGLCISSIIVVQIET